MIDDIFLLFLPEIGSRPSQRIHLAAGSPAGRRGRQSPVDKAVVTLCSDACFSFSSLTQFFDEHILDVALK